MLEMSQEMESNLFGIETKFQENGRYVKLESHAFSGRVVLYDRDHHRCFPSKHECHVVKDVPTPLQLPEGQGAAT